MLIYEQNKVSKIKLKLKKCEQIVNKKENYINRILERVLGVCL